MIGGNEALERLAQMLDDGDPNTRYNAATGLARHGDARALPVLGEMLDPNNTEALVDAEARRDQDVASGNDWKRALVLSNGIRAARQMVEQRPQADYSELVKWLEELEASQANGRIKLDAKALRLEINQLTAAAAG
jgi:HEAT repeat protein